ncbi:LysM peptidoglycan-binding domain-containing protein [Aquibacillus sp. 3ASR75-11]|uniref:LysM peptidoglycan-binding domain-containing protein n=1 Tax=Terrihalobacillus insolitus TaxID=2950438 RepID=A0A9X3WRA8_9BACI|nr:LysM peptidoglycan-binding domain-containing protein [Terrihalobacillus insolitus]MDC3412450.1 LysM peptidoglycan-binding domain-containing protein [Terrihalobacillus insolitus]MDC3423870.1 LysM peptidoglycan-binding domain-containing protein [Terrihalobacillus insolitus]
MKIHVAQKGETLQEIAQRHDVVFDELKEMNTHLSNPDMIMPGMKIRIPSSSKQVRKESATAPMKKKEEPKEVPMPKEIIQYPTEHPYKDTSPKAMPVMKEDDTVKPLNNKIPVDPLKGINDQKFDQEPGNAKDNWKAPTMPGFPMDKKGYGDKKMSFGPENATHHQVPAPYGGAPTPFQGVPNGMPWVQGEPAGYPAQPVGQYGVGSHAPLPPQHVSPQQSYHQPVHEEYGENWMESSSSVEIPQLPYHLAGTPKKQNCGCGSGNNVTYPPYGAVSPYGQPGYQTFVPRPQGGVPNQPVAPKPAYPGYPGGTLNQPVVPNQAYPGYQGGTPNQPVAPNQAYPGYPGGTPNQPVVPNQAYPGYPGGTPNQPVAPNQAYPGYPIPPVSGGYGYNNPGFNRSDESGEGSE